MPEKKPKRIDKNSISHRDNPYLNSKIYPITGIISSGFLDPYLQNHFDSPNMYLKNKYFGDICDEINNYIGKLSELLMVHTDSLNDNNLELLSNLYDKIVNSYHKAKYPDDYIDKLNNLLKVIDPYSLVNGVYNEDAVQCVLKFNYIDILNRTLMVYANKSLEEYNATTYYNSYGFVDFSEIVCVHKKYGVIIKNKSNLVENDLGVLKMYANNLFDYFEKTCNLKTDAILIEYMRLLFTIKGQPIGAIFVDPEVPKKSKDYVDYFNGEEIRNMFSDDNGSDDDDDFDGSNC